MKRFVLVGVILAMVMSVAAVPVLADDTEGNIDGWRSRPADVTLGEVLTAEGTGGYDRRGWDYDVARNAVLAIADANPATPLLAAFDADAELTILLPNDRAFRRLVRDLTGEWVRESDVVGALLGVLTLGDIEGVFANHVFAGVIDYRAARGADGVELTAVGGGTITVDVKWRRFVRFIDDSRPYPWVVDRDNFATNGVFHGISEVILSS